MWLLGQFFGIRPAPHGAGGLKLLIGGAIGIFGRPAPHGAGGLKSVADL